MSPPPPICQLCNAYMYVMPDSVPEYWDFDPYPPLELASHTLYVCPFCSEACEAATGVYAYTCKECYRPLYMEKCTNFLEQTDKESKLFKPIVIAHSVAIALADACDDDGEDEIDVSDLDTYTWSERIHYMDKDTGELYSLGPAGEEGKSCPITFCCRNQNCSEAEEELESDLFG